MTSRNPNIALNPAGDGFNVLPFDDSDASDVLLRLTNADVGSGANQELAKEIARTLGGLPLALNQIGSFMNQRKIPPKKFPAIVRAECE